MAILCIYMVGYADQLRTDYTLDIQIPPEKVFWVYFGGSNFASQQVFGCLGTRNS